MIASEAHKADESAELVEFRTRARAWLAESAERRDAVQVSDDALDENDGESLHALETAKRFQAKLFDAGLAGLSWPKVYGGQGLTMEHQRVFNEEAADYVIPTGPFIIGLGMCAPTLLEYGTEEQRLAHVPRMLRGDEVWCQLFSEPGAGSDVASLQTRAVRDGEEWVLNGQKVWTSGGHYSDYGLIVTRTNVDVPKHKGITMFIVDMRSPGVSIRPLRQMTGTSGFNEVFFDDVRVPSSNLVGAVDEGWRAAIGTLMNERVSIGAGGGGLGRRVGGGEFDALIELARDRGVLADPVLRQSLASVYIEERILELLSQRIRADVRAGKAPGPEGSIAKLAGTQLARHVADVAEEILGAAGQAWEPGDAVSRRWTTALLAAPGNSIAGGTPEIMKNILGERVLGLPKEPQVDRDVPFRDVKVSG
ncbi:acyl-CoA dehydrogenase family protein [Streptosporangium sp. NPDC002544]|uniref:acyl-CoA dehydrogenase family protein n=1 Tax=Streptosporangium sp. NPDC002544 TaxID=3154538 RepID=UPI00332200CB